MAGISRYEKMVLAMTAVFLLVTGGWFFARQNTGTPYEVTTEQSSKERPISSQSEQPEENKSPDSLTEGEVINLNAADVYDLQRLPGIGEKRAQAIVEYREEHGPFRTVEDVTQVSGIGAGILAGMEEYATVG
ncbi:MAG: ComEA family DNA-binding protein [Lawsonibacter sp.]|nr:ComEA family DNA-binding protein [Lawsonibacter sp.]